MNVTSASFCLKIIIIYEAQIYGLVFHNSLVTVFGVMDLAIVNFRERLIGILDTFSQLVGLIVFA